MARRTRSSAAKPRKVARKATRKSAARSPKRASKQAAQDVSIRMYRLGVGDCFLLRFPTRQGDFTMLIDCGVHMAQSGGTTLIKQVAEHIMQTTGGRLDVLVATHEHWDHISGFRDAKVQFKDLKADRLWLAWLENPEEEFKRRYKEHRRQSLALIEEASKHAGFGANRSRLGILQGFFGDDRGVKLMEAGDNLRSKCAAGATFLRPGQAPIELPGNRARVFVLAPPEDIAAIKKDQPSSGARSEVYPLAARELGAAAFAACVQGRGQPFDRRYTLPLSLALGLDFFQSNYTAVRATQPASALPPVDAVGTPAEEDLTQDWRRIDHDWLQGATQLALALDSDTNNTSLVLAIELGPPQATDNPVLLFAGDAQVGSWLTWSRVEFPEYHGRQITGADLLRRTKVYKVGHHASHNATARAEGLERMEALDLALIPTDAKMAEKVDWGTIPWAALLTRLEEKTKKRVLRTDLAAPAKLDGFKLERHDLFYEVSF